MEDLLHTIIDHIVFHLKKERGEEEDYEPNEFKALTL
jgi:hypothetical protein